MILSSLTLVRIKITTEINTTQEYKVLSTSVEVAKQKALDFHNFFSPDKALFAEVISSENIDIAQEPLMNHLDFAGLSNVINRIQTGIMEKTFYRGIQTFKCPMDAWTYQQIIHDTRPNIIVEIGTNRGGSALMFADMLSNEGISNSHVITMDIGDHCVEQVRNDPRITFIHASAPHCLPTVQKKIKALNLYEPKIMVIEDSSHAEQHVFDLLEAFSPMVSKGCYYIVEDTIIDLGLERNYSGPVKAIKRFLETHREFESDPDREQFFLSWNSGGFLKRI